MRIDEILDLKYFNDEGALQRLTRQYNESNTKKEITKIGNFKIVQSNKENEDGVRWFIVDGDGNPKGLVTFSPRTGISKVYFTSTYAWLDNSLRGQGLVSKLYEEFINRNGALMSDFEQSESSKRIWKSLFNKFKCYGIYWNDEQEMEWGKIDSKEELEKAWPPVDKYKRLLLSKTDINTKE